MQGWVDKLFRGRQQCRRRRLYEGLQSPNKVYCQAELMGFLCLQVQRACLIREIWSKRMQPRAASQPPKRSKIGVMMTNDTLPGCDEDCL